MLDKLHFNFQLQRHMIICPELDCFCMGLGDGPCIFLGRQKGIMLEEPACPRVPPPTSLLLPVWVCICLWD